MGRGRGIIGRGLYDFGEPYGQGKGGEFLATDCTDCTDLGRGNEKELVALRGY